MPDRRAPSRLPQRSLQDINGEIHRAQNEHLMEGIVSGCALVAYADGWATTEEHDRMLALIRGFQPIAAFGLDDVTATFDALTARFAADHAEGEAAALQAVALVKGAAAYPTLLVEACCAIAAADGGFDAEERLVVVGICERRELDPASFGLAEAP